MLESKPERREGDRSMRAVFLSTAFCFFHTLVYNALNSRGLGAGPHYNLVKSPFILSGCYKTCSAMSQTMA